MNTYFSAALNLMKKFYSTFIVLKKTHTQPLDRNLCWNQKQFIYGDEVKNRAELSLGTERGEEGGQSRDIQQNVVGYESYSKESILILRWIYPGDEAVLVKEKLGE